MSGVAFVDDDGVDANVDKDQEGKEQSKNTQFAVSDARNDGSFVGKHVVQVTQCAFGAAVHGTLYVQAFCPVVSQCSGGG